LVAKAAILDIDGTLVDTNYHHAVAWYRAFSQLEVEVPLWRIHRHIGAGWTTSADVEETKPEPDLVKAALDKAGTKDAVMIGDTTWDIKAAKKAEIPTLAVLTGGFGEDELREAGAAEVFESVDSLRKKLDDTPLGGDA
jgi:phosphoglycolate phosphatase-like HAD superfamily hydrolase